MAFEHAKGVNAVVQRSVDHNVVAKREHSDTPAKVRTKLAHLGLGSIESQFLIKLIQETTSGGGTVVELADVFGDFRQVAVRLLIEKDAGH